MRRVKDNKISKWCLKGFLLFTFNLLTISPAPAQEVVDKMVATVNGGVKVELITYSDILWQLALQPDTPLSNPSSENLNLALRRLIEQRLILRRQTSYRRLPRPIRR